MYLLDAVAVLHVIFTVAKQILIQLHLNTFSHTHTFLHRVIVNAKLGNLLFSKDTLTFFSYVFLPFYAFFSFTLEALSANKLFASVNFFQLKDYIACLQYNVLNIMSTNYNNSKNY